MCHCWQLRFLSNGQGRKSRHLPRASCWVELNSQRFDAVAEASELPDHSRSACSLQPFAHGLAAFLVANPSVQDHPDQTSPATVGVENTQPPVSYCHAILPAVDSF